MKICHKFLLFCFASKEWEALMIFQQQTLTHSTAGLQRTASDLEALVKVRNNRFTSMVESEPFKFCDISRDTLYHAQWVCT